MPISKDAQKLAERVDALDGFRTTDATGPHKGKAYVVQRWDEERRRWRYVDRISAHASYGGLALVRAETSLRNKGVPLPRTDKTPPKEERQVATATRKAANVDALRKRMRQLLTTRYGGDLGLLSRDAAAIVAESEIEQFGGARSRSRPSDVAQHAIEAFLGDRTMSPLNVSRLELVVDHLEKGGPPLAPATPSVEALRAAVKVAVNTLAEGMGDYDDPQAAARGTFAYRCGHRVEAPNEREPVLTLWRFLDGTDDPSPKYAAAFDAEAKLPQAVPPATASSRMIVARSKNYVAMESLREPSARLRERLLAVLAERGADTWTGKRGPSAARAAFAAEILPLLEPTVRKKERVAWNTDKIVSWLGKFVQDPESRTEAEHLRIWNKALDALEQKPQLPGTENGAKSEREKRSLAKLDAKPKPTPAPREDPAQPDPPARFAVDQARVQELYEKIEFYEELEKELRDEVERANADRDKHAEEKRAIIEELAASDAERERIADAVHAVEATAAGLEQEARDLQTRLDAALEFARAEAATPVRDGRFESDYRALLLRLAERARGIEAREQVLRRLDALARLDLGDDVGVEEVAAFVESQRG